jgi:hypothetical protein
MSFENFIADWIMFFGLLTEIWSKHVRFALAFYFLERVLLGSTPTEAAEGFHKHVERSIIESGNARALMNRS